MAHTPSTLNQQQKHIETAALLLRVVAGVALFRLLLKLPAISIDSALLGALIAPGLLRKKMQAWWLGSILMGWKLAITGSQLFEFGDPGIWTLVRCALYVATFTCLMLGREAMTSLPHRLDGVGQSSS